MSRVWGREETTGWPTRQPAFTITAFLLAAVSVMAVWCYRYEFVWTPLERYWYPAFANMHLMGMIGAKTGTYQLLEVENARGQHRLAVEGDLVPLDKPPLGSRVPLALSEETYRKGFRLVLQPRTSYDNEKLNARKAFSAKKDGEYPLDDVYLCLSVTEPFEKDGRCHKLVAAVIKNPPL